MTSSGRVANSWPDLMPVPTRTVNAGRSGAKWSSKTSPPKYARSAAKCAAKPPLKPKAAGETRNDRRMKQTLSPLSLALTLTLLAAGAFAQNLELPAPQKTGGMPLMEALAKRSTSRAFDSKDLSPQQLSGLLWASFGINRPDGKRTAPSAMNFQETDIYVLLKQGAYVYSAKSNKLDLVVAEDIRALGGTQAFVKDAPVTLVFVADLSKMGGGTNEDKKNTANIDVGYISQNVY